MRESKLRKIIFLIVALIGLSGILLGLYWNLNGNENYGQISLGFGGGLLAWLLTFLIVNWIDTSRGSHYRNTEEILDVVKEKYLSLKDKERSKLDSSYYESHYALADEVRISGIATKSFVKYLVEGLSKDKLPPSHLLQVMQDRPVTVKVLLMDPGSDVVKMENRRDDPTHGQEHTKVICRVLGHWKAIFKKLSELKLDPKSEIIVRLNCMTLNTTLFSTSNSNGTNGVMLMGMLWAHKPGTKSQHFEIPRSNIDGSLYRDCRDHFDRLWYWCEQREIVSLLGRNRGSRFNRDLWKMLADKHGCEDELDTDSPR